ncbi:hypothetical protein [Collimonas humicola]|uniref:hypothetical protein n=1 Tax=Collimonas humicola TaxID=2825886 RepID=UPI001B8D0761|nr:hypothetical protein [Collimonas humicola]
MSDMRVGNWVAAPAQKKQAARREVAPPYTPQPPVRPTRAPASVRPLAPPAKNNKRAQEREGVGAKSRPALAQRAKPLETPSLTKGLNMRPQDDALALLDGQDDAGERLAGAAAGAAGAQEPAGAEPGAANAGQAACGQAQPTGGGDDFDTVLQLPITGDNGIFEVALPGGETMGVVVNAQASQVSLLLTPSSEKTGGRLRQRRMELEGRLERQMQRNVKITIL